MLVALYSFCFKLQKSKSNYMLFISGLYLQTQIFSPDEKWLTTLVTECMWQCLLTVKIGLEVLYWSCNNILYEIDRDKITWQAFAMKQSSSSLRWVHEYQDACINKLESFLRGQLKTLPDKMCRAKAQRGTPKKGSRSTLTPQSSFELPKPLDWTLDDTPIIGTLVRYFE